MLRFIALQSGKPASVASCAIMALANGLCPVTAADGGYRPSFSDLEAKQDSANLRAFLTACNGLMGGLNP